MINTYFTNGMKKLLILLIIFMVFGSFCTPNHEEKGSMDNRLFAYDLKNPDTSFKLPSFLEEISGISYYGKDKIACVEDENANIYILSLKKEKIIQVYDFGNDADYEDIVIVGKTAYILRNNGHIFRVEEFKNKDLKVKIFITPLKEKNNTEGMVFDPLSNSLFISCKGSPSIDEENSYEGYKAVYKFDLESEKLNTRPHFLIDLENIDSYIDHNGFTKLSIKIAKSLRLIESETSFQPSGIAIHPFDDQIYIISSVGKLLIILNRRGEILDVRELDAKLFQQPEGICFSPSGDLFISNEGRGEKGYILKFSYHAIK
jgi:SdiA-regulated protein